MAVYDGKLKGTLFVLLAALLWATSGVGGKYLFASGVTPLALVQARAIISTLLMGVFLLARAPSLVTVRKNDVPLTALLGVVLGLTQWSYFMAISRIQVAAAILIQYLAPAIVAVVGLIWLSDKLTLRKTSAIVLALAGCWFVVGGGGLTLSGIDSLGVSAGLLSAFCFAGYSLVSERMMAKYTPWTTSFYAFFGSAVFLNLARFDGALTPGVYNAEQWMLFIYIGIMGTAVPFTLFIAGINNIRASRASIIGTTEPLFAGVFAWLLLGENMSPAQLLGGAITIAAIVILQLDRSGLEGSPANIRTALSEPHSGE
ncbi:MAG: hypothetical protein C0609_03100 [Deltaproteobacteria bacterium]|nr:MAG: hypothetical protein C0609_03100 [Deltaproteobacteria bacterium]